MSEVTNSVPPKDETLAVSGDGLTNDTPNIKEEAYSAPNSVKHNTNNERTSNVNATPVEASTDRFIQMLDDSVNSKVRERTTQYLESINYNVSDWVDTVSPSINYKAKWAEEERKYNASRWDTDRIDMRAAAFLAMSMVKKNPAAYADSIQRLRLAEMSKDASNYDRDDGFFNKMLTEKWASLYYDLLTNTKLPKELAVAFNTSYLMRELTPDEVNKVNQIFVNQNDRAKRLNEVGLFYQPTDGSDDWYRTRHGDLTRWTTELNERLWNNPNPSPEDYIDLAYEDILVNTVRGKDDWVDMVVGTFSEMGVVMVQGDLGMKTPLFRDAEQVFGSAITNVALNEAGVDDSQFKLSTEDQSLVGRKLLNKYHASKIYSIATKGRAAFVMDTIRGMQDPKNPQVDASSMFRQLMNDPMTKAYLFTGATTDWLTFVAGGAGKGNAAAGQLANKIANRLAGKAAAKNLPNALTGFLARTGREAADEAADSFKSSLGRYALNFTALTALQQAFEGTENALVNKVRVAHGVSKDSAVKAFAQGATENILANMAFNSIGTAPAMALDTFRLARAQKNADALGMIERQAKDMGNFKDMQPEVRKEIAKLMIKAGETNSHMYFKRADLLEAREMFAEAGAEKQVAAIDSALERYKDYAVDPNADPEVMMYQVPTEEYIMDAADPDVLTALHDRVSTDINGNTRKDIIDDITSTLTANVDEAGRVNPSIFTDPLKNERAKNMYVSNAYLKFKGDISAMVSDLRVKGLGSKEVDLYAKQAAHMFTDLASSIGMKTDELMEKYPFKIELIEEVFDTTDKSNTKVLGDFDPYTFTIRVGKNSNFATLSHETLHIFNEIIMREEETIRARGKSPLTDAIDNIRKIGEIPEGTKWLDIDPHKREAIQELLVADYFYYALGKVKSGDLLDNKKMHNATAMYEMAIATGVRRMYADRLNQITIPEGVSPHSREVIQAKTEEAQRLYKENYATSYGDYKGKILGGDELNLYRYLVGSMLAKQRIGFELRNRLNYDDNLTFLRKMYEVIEQGNFDPEIMVAVKAALDKSRLVMDDIYHRAVADAAPYAPLMAQAAEKIDSNTGTLTNAFGSIARSEKTGEATAVSSSHARLSWRGRLEDFKQDTGLDKFEANAANAQRRVDDIDMDISALDENLATIEKLAKRKGSVADNIVDKRRQTLSADINKAKAEITARIEALDAEMDKVKAELAEAPNKKIEADAKRKLVDLKKQRNREASLLNDKNAYEAKHGRGSWEKVSIQSELLKGGENLKGKEKIEHARAVHAEKKAKLMAAREEAMSALVKAKDDLYNTMDKHRAELEKFKQEDEILKKVELANMRNEAIARERNKRMHAERQREIKAIRKDLKDPTSPYSIEYNRLGAIHDAFDTVQIEEASLRDLANEIGYDPNITESLIDMARSRGWLNSDGQPVKGKSGLEKEIIDADTATARFGNGDAGELLTTLEELNAFDRDPEVYAKNVIDNIESRQYNHWHSDGGLNSKLIEYEQEFYASMEEILQGLATDIYNALNLKDKRLGRGDILKNLAMLTQHEAGGLRMNNASVFHQLQRSRMYIRSMVKNLRSIKTYPKAQENLLAALRSMRTAGESVRLHNKATTSLDKIKKFVKSDAKRRYENYDADLTMLVEVISNRIGLINKDSQYYALDAAKRAEVWDRAMMHLKKAMGDADVSERDYNAVVSILTDSGFNGDYRNMQIGQVLALTQGMSAMIRAAKKIKDVEKNDVKNSLATKQSELISTIKDAAMSDPKARKKMGLQEDGNYTEEVGLGQSKSNRNFGQKFKDFFQDLRNRFLHPETICEILDKGTDGVFKKYVYNPIQEAHLKFTVKRKELYNRAAELYDAVNQLDKKNPRSVDITITGEYALGNGGSTMVRTYTFGKHGSFKGKPHAEVLQLVLQMGAPENRIAVARMFNVADEEADAFYKELVDKLYASGHINETVLRTAEGIWDIFRETRDLVSPTYHDLTGGKMLKEVKGEKMKFAFGEYEGGYIPLSVEDRYKKPLGEEDLHRTVSRVADIENQSFVEARTDVAAGTVRYDFSIQTLLRRMDEQVRYAYLAKPVTEIDSMLNNNAELKHLLASSGDLYDGFFKNWLLDVATGASQYNNEIGGGAFVRYLARVPSTMVMSLNIINAAMNVSNFFLAGARLQGELIPVMARGLFHLAVHPVDSFKVPALQSKYMNERMNGHKNSVERALRKATNTSKLYNVYELINEGAYVMQRMSQNFVDTVLWNGMYERNMRKLTKEHPRMPLDKIQDMARKKTEMVIRTTQGSMERIDLSDWEKSHPLTKVIMPFANFFIHQRNLAMSQWAISSADKRFFAKWSQRAWLIGCGFLATNMSAEFIRMALNGDLTNNSDKTPEDNLESATWATVKSGISTYNPLIGQVASYGIDKYIRHEYTGSGPFSTPTLTWAESVMKSVHAAQQALMEDKDLDERDLRNFTTSLGIFCPVIPNATRYVTTGYNTLNGEYYSTDAIDTARALVTGRPSADMKN